MKERFLRIDEETFYLGCSLNHCYKSVCKLQELTSHKNFELLAGFLSVKESEILMAMICYRHVVMSEQLSCHSVCHITSWP